MGVGKGTPLSRESVHMRSVRLRVASQETGPIVEIIDANHQHVGRWRISHRFLRDDWAAAEVSACNDGN